MAKRATKAKTAPVKPKRKYVKKSLRPPQDMRSQKGRNMTGLVPFKKGQKGLGRKPGAVNKFTFKLKEAIMEAAERSGRDGRGKDGAVGYLVWLSRNEPAVFGRMMEKALPTQVEVKDKTDRTMNAKEAVERLRERGLPVPPALVSLARTVGMAVAEAQERADDAALDGVDEDSIDVDADEESEEEDEGSDRDAA